MITILHNPAETTGILAFHHFLQPFHPHPHSILPPLLALIQQASAHISQQGTAASPPGTNEQRELSFSLPSWYNSHIEYPHTTTMNIIGSQWTYRVKRDNLDHINKFKARLTYTYVNPTVSSRREMRTWSASYPRVYTDSNSPDKCGITCWKNNSHALNLHPRMLILWFISSSAMITL